MPLKFEAPSFGLQRELNEVAKKALALDEYLLGANFLPPLFPTDQVRTLCQSLAALRFGTAEGCREPLVYGRSRLPAIRREHISSGDQEIDLETDGSSPTVLRGEELDRRLSELAISVVTALDQYQTDASEVLQESIDAVGGIDPNEIHALGETVEKSEALEEKLDAASKTIEHIKNPNSKTANDLERQLNDAKTHTSVARTEISMPAPRINWLKPVLAVVDALPDIIRNTGYAIEATTDIARPLVTRWDEFWSNLKSFLLDEMKSVGTSLRHVADEMDKWKSGKHHTLSQFGAEIAVEGASSNARLEKTRKKRPGGFAPQSSPPLAVQAFAKIFESPGLPREELTKAVGRNALRDLAALGLIQTKKRRVYPVQKSVLDYELAVKVAAGSTESLKIVRHILSENPNATPLEIADAVEKKIGRNWPKKETKQRYGMHLRRWMIWVERHVIDPASSSEAYALVVNAARNEASRGRPRKITAAKAREILELRSKGLNQKEIAKKMDMSPATIGKFLRVQ